MTLALLAVLGVLCIVAVNLIAPKVGVSAPLGLVAVGIVASLLRLVPAFSMPPEWILAGVLPLLLYAASVSMPAMEFRRDFRAISGLSVSLVVMSSVALGWFFSRALPGLGLAGGIALGAIISPTDAVATSIVKKLGVAPRAVAVLDGESLLNDASALVLLRSAVAATAATVSLWQVARTFATSILIASTIGVLVGYGALRLRQNIPQATVNTLLSFAVPFVAYEPTEHFGASGLVAVVAAGLVIGHASPSYLAAAHRHNDEQNWRTVELLLEGAVFLVMGLQLVAIVEDVRVSSDRVVDALYLAAAALLITLVVRTLFVGPLLWTLRRVQRQYEKSRPRLEDMHGRLVEVEVDANGVAKPVDANGVAKPVDFTGANKRAQRRAEHTLKRVRRVLADADYVTSRPLGTRHGVLLVWAGMRGAITLAAAQTLPREMPHRSLLVLVAFLVAAGSLLLQGGTLPWVVRRLGLPPPDPATSERERDAIGTAIEEAALAALLDPSLCKADGTPYEAALVDLVRERLVDALHDPEHHRKWSEASELGRRILDAQRKRLLRIRRDGTCSSESLREALARIDAQQISLEHSEG